MRPSSLDHEWEMCRKRVTPNSLVLRCLIDILMATFFVRFACTNLFYSWFIGNQPDPERGGDIHQDGYQNSSRSHSKIHYTFIPENDEDGVNGQNQSGSQHVLNRKKIYFTRSFSIP